jgi:ParB-like chromosome segregation protein Spo0J
MSKTQVPLDQINDNPNQVRIDTGNVDSLAEKILEHGLRQLPEARILDDGEHVTGSFPAYCESVKGSWFLRKGEAQLATGHRRVHAIRLLNADDTPTEQDLFDAGLRPGHVPVDLQRITDEEMLDLLTIENAAREDLSPVEQARLIQQHEDTGRTQSEIAEVFGRSQSWVSHRSGLLDLPDYVRAHIHEGDLAVRQARALKPIFKADTENVDFPEGNSFHPETIIENALGGTPSGTLRKQVTQFESWLRQLKGETQEEIRKQEYEQELESDLQNDERESDQRDAEKPDQSDERDNARAPAEDALSTSDRGSRKTSSSQRKNLQAGQKERRTGERDESEGSASESVGANGEAFHLDTQPSTSTDPDQRVRKAEEIVATVARQLSDKVDAATPTWALMALGAGRSADRRTLIEQQIWSRMSQVEANDPREIAGAIRDWLRPMGVTGIDVPQPSSVAEVDPE